MGSLNADGLVDVWCANYKRVGDRTFQRLGRPGRSEEQPEVRLPTTKQFGGVTEKPRVHVAVAIPDCESPTDGDLAKRLCDEALLAANPGCSIMNT